MMETWAAGAGTRLHDDAPTADATAPPNRSLRRNGMLMPRPTPTDGFRRLPGPAEPENGRVPARCPAGNRQAPEACGHARPGRCEASTAFAANGIAAVALRPW